MNDQTAGQTGKQQVLGPTDALSESNLVVDLARVDIDQAVATAHRFPRNYAVVRKQLEEIVFSDEASPKACIYALPRAGKPIVGPSVYFADALATAFGHCHDGSRYVRVDRHDKIVVCEGIFWDLQSNRRTVATATRNICTRDGRIFNQDMIQVTSAACQRIAQRNAIMRGVPRPIWHPYYERALIAVRGLEATLPERRDELIKLFASHGVDPMRIAGALGVTKRDEITLDMMVVLQGMWEQLRNGDITAEEMFDPRRMTGAGIETDQDPLGDAPQATGGSPGSPPAGTGPGAASTAPAASGEPAASEGAAKAPGKAARTSKPAKATEEASTEERKPEASPKPASPHEYTEHAKRWLAAATLADIDSKWRKERELRKSLDLAPELLAELDALKKARIKELGG